ncbi:unnamed protein product, partial [Effrenium voratum]
MAGDELGVDLRYYRFKALGGALRDVFHVDPASAPALGSDGTHTWLRTGNSEPERAARRAVAGQTSRCVECLGYVLGNQTVLLRYISRCVAGTKLVSPSCGFWPTADTTLPEPSATSSLVFEQRTVLESAEAWCAKGYKVAAVNAASAYHCGGGFSSGGRHALEESMCVQSTLYSSLQRGQQLAHEANVRSPPWLGDRWTPHLPADGALLSPWVEVFRRGTNEGYPFMQRPFLLQAMISVAMPNRNERMSDSPVDAPRDHTEYMEALKARWRAALVAAFVAGANCLVLPDAGCGVFRNEPQAVGRALGEALLVLGSAFEQVVLASPAAATGRACADAALAVFADANPAATISEEAPPVWSY